MAFLEGPSPKILEIIKQELGEGPGDLEKGVRSLQNMCAVSPHLPDPSCVDTHLLEIFVRGCRMDLNRARKKFEAFCLLRAQNRDLYEHRSLNEPPLNHFCEFMDILPLPKLTDEGLRVTLFRVRPGYAESASDIAVGVRAALLVSDARMHDEKPIAGDVFVYELSHIRASLVGCLATAFNSVRRGIHMAQAAYPQRLKRIHMVNAPPFFASTLQLVKACINEKVRRRIYLHTKVEDLFEHIPARVLPSEWGGEEESMDVIAKRWRGRIDEVRDYLRELNEMSDSATETLPDNDIYGAVGAFRKLDID